MVGVPFCGQQYLRTGSKNNGLDTPFDNTGLDPNLLGADVAIQPSLHALVEAGYVSEDGRIGGNGYKVGWNLLAGEPYLYSSAASHPNLTTGPATVPTVIAFSSSASIAERTVLIKKLKLRGAMAWELSQDSDSGSLISALAPTLN